MPDAAIQQTVQNLQSAEGYLELGSMFEDRWSLDLPLRQVMSDSAMYHLNQITDPRGHASTVLYLKGQACRMAERYPQAIEWFNELIKIEPDNMHALLAVAWCHKRTDDLASSIAAMEQAIDWNQTTRSLIITSPATWHSMAKFNRVSVDWPRP